MNHYLIFILLLPDLIVLVKVILLNLIIAFFFLLFRSFQVCLGHKGNELPTTQSPTGISLENKNSSIFMLYEVLAFYEYRYMTFVLTLRRNQAFCCKISLCHVLELVMINTYKPLLLVVEKLWIYWLSNYLTKANNIRPDNDSSLHVSLIRHIS